MRKFFEKLIYTEIPENFKHPLVKPVAIIWGIVTAALLYGFLFLFDGDVNVFKKAYQYFDTPDTQLLLYVFVGCTLLGVAFRALFAVIGITHHDKKLDYTLDDRYLVFTISSILVLNLIMLFVYFLVAVVIFMLGSSFSDSINYGFNFKILTDYYDSIVDKVPTLFHLNYYLTLVVVYLVYRLFAYFWHRMGHESRILWLLSHRPHHISTTLTSATTFEADPAFALGLLWKSFAVGFLGSVIAKMFSTDDFFIEIVVFTMVTGTLEIFNHTSAYYEYVRNSKFWWPITKILGLGPMHYMHHSAHPDHTVVNVGGDIFLFWDRVFGTYVEPPKQKPPIGLTNQPDIYMNPINMAFSGVLQILYELKHNSLKLWPKIIFGGIYYIPPKTKSFLMKDERTYYSSDEKVAKYNPDLDL